MSDRLSLHGAQVFDGGRSTDWRHQRRANSISPARGGCETTRLCDSLNRAMPRNSWRVNSASALANGR